MNWKEIDLSWLPVAIGWTATTLLMFSILAQMYLYYRSKDASTMSYTFVILQIVVNGMYLYSNIEAGSVPQSVGNAGSIVLLIGMMIMGWYYAKYYSPSQHSSVQPELELQDYAQMSSAMNLHLYTSE